MGKGKKELQKIILLIKGHKEDRMLRTGRVRRGDITLIKKNVEVNTL